MGCQVFSYGQCTQLEYFLGLLKFKTFFGVCLIFLGGGAVTPLKSLMVIKTVQFNHNLEIISINANWCTELTHFQSIPVKIIKGHNSVEN